MAYEPKPGDVSVFKNGRKEKDTHPDYRITGLDLNGDKIKGALWLKTDRNGNKYMSGKIEPDTYQREGEFPGGGRGADRSVSGGGGGGQSYDLSDDIPFARMARDGEA